MTISLWCILVALLAPYILSVLARSGVTKADYVQNPRAFNEQLTGWHRHAHLAQLNAFETFPGFAAAVLVAHFNQVPQLQVDTVLPLPSSYFASSTPASTSPINPISVASVGKWACSVSSAYLSYLLSPSKSNTPQAWHHYSAT